MKSHLYRRKKHNHNCQVCRGRVDIVRVPGVCARQSTSVYGSSACFSGHSFIAPASDSEMDAEVHHCYCYYYEFTKSKIQANHAQIIYDTPAHNNKKPFQYVKHRVNLTLSGSQPMKGDSLTLHSSIKS